MNLMSSFLLQSSKDFRMRVLVLLHESIKIQHDVGLNKERVWQEVLRFLPSVNGLEGGDGNALKTMNIAKVWH